VRGDATSAAPGGAVGAVRGGAATAGQVTRILVVDDHRTFAELLSMALDSEPDLTCVGHALSAGEAFALAARLRPDVVIMDVQLPDLDGLEATRRLVADCPALRVIVLTAHVGPEFVARAAAAGACAFLPKDGALAEMLRTVRTAHRGTLVLMPEAVLALAADRAGGAAGEWGSEAADYLGPALTPRERDVLALMGAGLDPRAIARRLGISLHTSRGHVKSLLAKLGAHSQLEAVVVASRRGLIKVEDRAGTGQ
jgi:DNA-binding NarL/FixJ family response regulator